MIRRSQRTCLDCDPVSLGSSFLNSTCPASPGCDGGVKGAQYGCGINQTTFPESLAREGGKPRSEAEIELLRERGKSGRSMEWLGLRA